MPKFRITLKRETKLIEQMFDELLKEKRMKKMEAAFSKAIFKSRSGALFGIIKSKVIKMGWVVKNEKDLLIIDDKGTTEYVIEQKNRFEDLMFGDHQKLKSDEEYRKVMDDRILLKIVSKLKTAVKGSKEWAIEKALSGGTVLDFFNRTGITISWTVLR